MSGKSSLTLNQEKKEEKSKEKYQQIEIPNINNTQINKLQT